MLTIFSRNAKKKSEKTIESQIKVQLMANSLYWGMLKKALKMKSYKKKNWNSIFQKKIHC